MGWRVPKSARKNYYVRQKPHVTDDDCDSRYNTGCLLARNLRCPATTGSVRFLRGLRADRGSVSVASKNSKAKRFYSRSDRCARSAG